MNVVVLTGRLTNDIELKTTQSGVSVCKFCLAVDKRVKSGEDKQANFINATAWRHSAEFLAKHFKKGDGVTILGEIETSQYTDKDGNKRTSFEVLVNNAEFPISKKSNSGEAVSEAKSDAPLEATFEEVGSEELPF